MEAMTSKCIQNMKIQLLVGKNEATLTFWRAKISSQGKHSVAALFPRLQNLHEYVRMGLRNFIHFIRILPVSMWYAFSKHILLQNNLEFQDDTVFLKYNLEMIKLPHFRTGILDSENPNAREICLKTLRKWNDLTSCKFHNNIL